MGRRLTAIVPIRGKQRAHDGQAPCPTWASSLPHLGNINAPNVPVDAQNRNQSVLWMKQDMEIPGLAALGVKETVAVMCGDSLAVMILWYSE